LQGFLRLSTVEHRLLHCQNLQRKKGEKRFGNYLGMHAAAVRALAVFIFEFRFHFISLNHFPYRQTPH